MRLNTTNTGQDDRVHWVRLIVHLLGMLANLAGHEYHLSPNEIFGRFSLTHSRRSHYSWLASYVGTLHEISSENSTVALEQVVSFGTEGRRPDDEVPASDNVYEYIVFRGSDVKDLRIEEGPKENNPPKPPVPDDPAILGVSAIHDSFSMLSR